MLHIYEMGTNYLSNRTHKEHSKTPNIIKEQTTEHNKKKTLKYLWDFLNFLKIYLIRNNTFCIKL